MKRLHVLILVGLVLGSAVLLRADAINWTLTIQPIQVCSNTGTSCGNTAQTLFEAEGDKIWSQAGIDLVFLPFTQFNNSDFLNIEGPGQKTLYDFPNYAMNTNPQIVDMWFVNSIAGAYGEGWVGFPGVAIADNVFSYNGGLGRIDSIAHELGHNLGLPHNDTQTYWLMASGGGFRDVPVDIGNITPDGDNLDRLSADEITTADGSGILVAVPEPASLTLMLAGAAGWASRRMRNKRS